MAGYSHLDRDCQWGKYPLFVHIRGGLSSCFERSRNFLSDIYNVPKNVNLEITPKQTINGREMIPFGELTSFDLRKTNGSCRNREDRNQLSCFVTLARSELQLKQ